MREGSVLSPSPWLADGHSHVHMVYSLYASLSANTPFYKDISPVGYGKDRYPQIRPNFEVLGPTTSTYEFWGRRETQSQFKSSFLNSIKEVKFCISLASNLIKTAANNIVQLNKPIYDLWFFHFKNWEFNLFWKCWQQKVLLEPIICLLFCHVCLSVFVQTATPSDYNFPDRAVSYKSL